MESKALILLSLFALPLSVFADTASDYANRGAQKYIFGDDDAAEAEISTGLTKFPDDPELKQVAGLLRKKPKQDKKDQSKQKQQQQQNQDGRGDQEKPDPNKDGNDKSAPKPGQTPTATPGNQQQENQPGSSPSPYDKGSGDKKEDQDKPGDGESDASPSPSGSPSAERSPSPSPSPGSGEGEQPESSPTASPASTPGKKLSGDVKGAGDEKPQQTPQPAEAVEAEPEKEGQMSEKQAQLLLQSMKDEEKRVQLDERKAARHVYKDW